MKTWTEWKTIHFEVVCLILQYFLGEGGGVGGGGVGGGRGSQLR